MRHCQLFKNIWHISLGCSSWFSGQKYSYWPGKCSKNLWLWFDERYWKCWRICTTKPGKIINIYILNGLTRVSLLLIMQFICMGSVIRSSWKERALMFQDLYTVVNLIIYLNYCLFSREKGSPFYLLR